MRPEDFSPGNVDGCVGAAAGSGRRFNEAGGFLPRKLARRMAEASQDMEASMRPEDFSPGNFSMAALIGENTPELQ